VQFHITPLLGGCIPIPVDIFPVVYHDLEEFVPCEMKYIIKLPGLSLRENVSSPLALMFMLRKSWSIGVDLHANANTHLLSFPKEGHKEGLVHKTFKKTL